MNYLVNNIKIWLNFFIAANTTLLDFYEQVFITGHNLKGDVMGKLCIWACVILLTCMHGRRVKTLMQVDLLENIQLCKLLNYLHNWNTQNQWMHV